MKDVNARKIEFNARKIELVVENIIRLTYGLTPIERAYVCKYICNLCKVDK